MRALLNMALLTVSAAFAHGAVWAQAAAPAPLAVPADDSLYQALGAKAGLDKLMADFVVRLAFDSRIGSFFKDTNQTQLAQQLSDQLCMISGGPCTYRGPPMKVAHADMDIGKRDFNALVEVLQQTMEAQGLAFTTQNRLLARLAPMHRDIINKP